MPRGGVRTPPLSDLPRACSDAALGLPKKLKVHIVPPAECHSGSPWPQLNALTSIFGRLSVQRRMEMVGGRWPYYSSLGYGT